MCRKTFGPLAEQMIDSLLYAKSTSHLKRLINLCYLENGTYDQIVAQLETELELSGLETDGELLILKMSTTSSFAQKWGKQCSLFLIKP